MSPEAKVAFINSQVALLNCEVAGMNAENQHRLSLGQSIAYDHAAFLAVMNGYYVGHNQVIEYLRDT